MTTLVLLLALAVAEILVVAWALGKSLADIEDERSRELGDYLHAGFAVVRFKLPPPDYTTVDDRLKQAHVTPLLTDRAHLSAELEYVARRGPRTRSVPWADIRLRLLLERRGPGDLDEFHRLVTSSFSTGERRMLTVRPAVMVS